MNSTVMVDVELDAAELDAIQEMQLRTWARQHYAPTADRDNRWHPIVLDEMKRKDGEGNGH